MFNDPWKTNKSYDSKQQYNQHIKADQVIHLIREGYEGREEP
jgi:hypothetical protein